MSRIAGYAFCTEAEYERLLAVDARQPQIDARNAQLAKALTKISGLAPAQSISGRTDWLQTCGEMRTIAAKALAASVSEGE